MSLGRTIWSYLVLNLVALAGCSSNNPTAPPSEKPNASANVQPLPKSVEEACPLTEVDFEGADSPLGATIAFRGQDVRQCDDGGVQLLKVLSYYKWLPVKRNRLPVMPPVLIFREGRFFIDVWTDAAQPFAEITMKEKAWRSYGKPDERNLAWQLFELVDKWPAEKK